MKTSDIQTLTGAESPPPMEHTHSHTHAQWQTASDTLWHYSTTCHSDIHRMRRTNLQQTAPDKEIITRTREGCAAVGGRVRRCASLCWCECLVAPFEHSHIWTFLITLSSAHSEEHLLFSMYEFYLHVCHLKIISAKVTKHPQTVNTEQIPSLCPLKK